MDRQRVRSMEKPDRERHWPQGDQLLGHYCKQLRQEMMKSRDITEGRLNESWPPTDGWAAAGRWV